MIMRIIKLLLLISIPLSLQIFSSCSKSKKPESPVDFVNPFIGTGGHGHTYPGASVPFGMVQLSPDTRLNGWDGCSAYHYSDSLVYGFSHTHLSGTGISDYADILLMPVTEQYRYENGNTEYGWESAFQHKNERAKPGYYSVLLDRYGIKAELTADARTGMHRYIFPEGSSRKIILDLKHRDFVLASSIHPKGKNEISGERRSRAWAQDQILFYDLAFSEDYDSIQLIVHDTLMPQLNQAEGKNLKAIIYFKKSNEPILVKVGISAVSEEGARLNRTTEIPDWDFDRQRKKARSLWEDELNKIEIEGATDEQKRVFYTALYHSYLNPNLYMDVDGKYRGTDMQVHQADNFSNYTVFSLWDTFRATHPLFTLTQRGRTRDFILTFLHQYQNGGQLPVWELSANYTGCMIGYHSVPVIVDAYAKGIRDFDLELAYKAMRHSAEMHHLGLDAYRAKGYIEINDEPESVSKTLEYAYDDWCIAQIARELHDTTAYKEYIQRAQSYKNLFNPATGFMQPKKDNIWKTPFDPREVDFNFTEANSWQYSFFVPQDVQTLIALHGGDAAFSAKLDSLFTAPSETSGRHQSDITGLIGQYAHGNEPSHHMAYLYNYAGKPWKSQKILRQIMDELYSNQPDGLSGNEDCGQMSSWYVLSTVGFYPVTPGSPDYVIGTPLFKKSTIHLENGKSFVIEAQDVSPKNIYIQSARLNGKKYSKSYISQNDIMQGGKLLLIMGPEPDTTWGAKPADRPKSQITEFLIQPVPVFEAASKTFYDHITVGISSPLPDAVIYYTLDGSTPDSTSNRYSEAITLNKSGSIRAIAYAPGLPPSKVVESSFLKIPKNRSIKLLSHYSNQYTAGGVNGLIDFIRGGNDFRDGTWQGYEGQDFAAIVDLGSPQKINCISTGFLQSIRSWIWIPKEVRFYVSDDGTHFRLLGTVQSAVPDDDYDNIRFEASIKPTLAYGRYVKVEAKSYGTVPDWHLGAGGKSWIFVDEIVIE
jgi:predicted alpha-1,2-mannosidase